MKKEVSEIWRRADAEMPPEGADPLLWELGQLRKVAQDALAHAARRRNLSATVSLLRPANGLLDLLSKIEESKTEELKAQQATEALQDERAMEDEFNRKLDELAERMRQAEAAAPKCPRCGQALPHGVQVEEEEPKPAGPGVH
jgi:DNA repair exonuclease SbcCD ATPase subunit